MTTSTTDARFAQEMVDHFAHHPAFVDNVFATGTVTLEQITALLDPTTCPIAKSQAHHFYATNGVVAECRGQERLLRTVWSAYGLDDLSGGCVQHVGMDAAGWDDGGEVSVTVHAPPNCVPRPGVSAANWNTPSRPTNPSSTTSTRYAATTSPVAARAVGCALSATAATATSDPH